MFPKQSFTVCPAPTLILPNIKKLYSLRYFVVHDVSLSNNSLPYKGIVQISFDAGIKNVCWQSLNNYAYNVICRQLLGFPYRISVQNISNPVDGKDAIFSGIINCNGREKYISQCSINIQESGSCSEITYIQCKFTASKNKR